MKTHSDHLQKKHYFLDSLALQNRWVFRSASDMTYVGIICDVSVTDLCEGHYSNKKNLFIKNFGSIFFGQMTQK